MPTFVFPQPIQTQGEGLTFRINDMQISHNEDIHILHILHKRGIHNHNKVCDEPGHHR